MITRKFIERVHDAFDELNYREIKISNADSFSKTADEFNSDNATQLDFDRFNQSAVHTLTHSRDLQDAINTVRLYKFCLKYWNKIEKMFAKKLHVFNEYRYEGNSLISIVSDKEAAGTYFITNGITKEVENIYVASHSFENGIFSLGYKHGKFTAFVGGNYYTKYAKMSSVKMKLFDNAGNCLCNIVLSENLGIFLENNLTRCELVIYDGVVAIFDRRYIDSLGKQDTINTDMRIADIEWDILEKNSELGLAKLNVYDANADLEMLLLFATSTFLLYHKYKQQQKALDFMMATHLWYR